jgi:uncharacterized protein
LYLPFKEEKLKNVARENGLEPLAKIIMAQNKEDIDFLATKYLNDTVNNEDAALQGARILLPNGSTKIFFVRKQLRRLYERKATITTKVVKPKKKKALKIQPIF